MLGRKIILGIVAVAVVGLLLVSQSLSQAQRGEGPRGPQGQPPEGRRFDPERMRRMMTERMKEMLEVTDEEWKVMEPKFTEVLNLSRQTRGGPGMGMMFGGRRGMMQSPGGRRQGPGGQMPDREQTEVDKRTEELRQVLENRDAKPAEIQNKLTALRQVREEVRQKLAKAQNELRQMLTRRQEAQCVLIGLLD